MACEVHLGCSPSKDAVEIFLGKSPCLFVWVDSSDGVAMVGDALPEKHKAAVAFLGGPSDEDREAGTGSKQMQCVTLQPSLGATEESSGSEDEEDVDVTSQSTLLQTLQPVSYTHLTLPTKA